jgi:hypothetical protein
MLQSLTGCCFLELTERTHLLVMLNPSGTVVIMFYVHAGSSHCSVTGVVLTLGKIDGSIVACLRGLPEQ